MTVNLETSNGFFKKAKYRIDASKQGYATSSTSFAASINGWYWGNIGFGGLIGWLIVDPATGAMWKLDDVYSVNLPSKTVSMKNGAAVRVTSINDVPLHVRGLLSKVD